MIPDLPFSVHKPERSSYTPLDFQGWRESSTLVLTPKFQRRGVWKTPAKSYLIDTILRGMPVPPIFLRVTQSDDKKRMIREVIDGQQRIAAVTDYLSGKYSLSSNLGTTYAGKQFEQLSEDQQDAIRQYALACEVFSNIGDEEVLQIFSRLNTYSVPLNAQELRNGRYFGPFKQSVYALAGEHLEFWRQYRLFTEQSIARMLEVELVSELLILEVPVYRPFGVLKHILRLNDTSGRDLFFPWRHGLISFRHADLRGTPSREL